GLAGAAEAEPEGEITREIREGLEGNYVRPRQRPPTPEEQLTEQHLQRLTAEEMLREGKDPNEKYIEGPQGDRPSPSAGMSAGEYLRKHPIKPCLPKGSLNP